MNQCDNNNCAGCTVNTAAHSLRKMGEQSVNTRYTIALAGNPNTGKSTVFNALTGLKQHTGNWPGKTVARAEGSFRYSDENFKVVDLPGTYSLLSTSEDEEIAREFILFGHPDVTVIVADATRLERNMNLILQILEITDKVVLCVNLLDEAQRNKIELDIRALSRRLGIPVVGASARSGKGIDELLAAIYSVIQGTYICHPYRIKSIPEDINRKVSLLDEEIRKVSPDQLNSRWLSFRMIEGDVGVLDRFPQKNIQDLAMKLKMEIGDGFHDLLSEAIYADAAEICSDVVRQSNKRGRAPLDVRIDKIVTSKVWGFPIMVLLLGGVLWLTIVGSNYPSELLSNFLVGWLHPTLKSLGDYIQMPWWLSGFLFDGVYLATAWVISVMLPPMAIFFPLFTLLEDFGYLPRVAFNLDEMFRRTGAHGKQALTMSMGFGCNAAGVVSTRIIDSPRERLIAIITNNFSLCNGRWPTQILIASIFLGAVVPPAVRGIVSIGSVLVVALLGVGFMFLTSWLLSRTVLRGEVSTFNLELPPYRPPQFWRTLYTSLIDRTLIVLWRAIVFAAPAGALIWLSCNITIAGSSIAEYLIRILEYPGWIMGLNGIILLAYVLAIPANEIVIPTVLMLTVLITGVHGGAGNGVLFEGDDNQIASLLHAGGWTILTGVNLMLFSLLHNPCSTTIYTIYKETGSRKWTAVATLLPLIMGIIVTILVAFVWRLFLPA
ncbi:ferrous iron transport protein B [Porphyromonas pogonae]|uniref:ferrous iron transport protein B n=1 Tax=Porphyromonas pogonae TaxID=867595 RepID=UPI002E77CE1B|nr:ferrous iron transport protein B [Porphyromonas pogonae]